MAWQRNNIQGTPMKSVLRFLLGLFMPIILIGLGAGVLGLGATYDIEVLIIAGFAVIGAGILWGVFLYLWASEGPFS